jgi:ATP-dependent DNA helicase PIF1
VNQPASITGLIDHVYPPDLLLRAATDPSAFRGRCLLTTLNTTVAELNTHILRRLPGQLRTYRSIDSLDTDETLGSDLHELPVEQLQSIDLPSLPPSQLNLKVGAPIILLRNLCPQEGLCNGTRMVITSLRTHCIEARLLGGDFDGQLRVIPRIKLSATDSSLGIALSRKQFPVRLCFVMTINKSQGQSFHTVGLDLRTPVFAHGQFYVGVSRTSSVEGLSILLPQENLSRTLNVIYPEVLANLL